MTDLRANASYLAAILVAVLTLHGCGSEDDPPPAEPNA